MIRPASRGNVTRALMGDPPPGRFQWSAPAPPPPPSLRYIGPTLGEALETTKPKEIVVADGNPAVAPTAAAEPVAPDEERTVRPIEPLEFDAPLTLRPVPTEAPEIAWLRPSELLVDETYQRDLSAAGRTLIRKIAETFDWRRFKPPIVAWTERGFEVVDGQHTALGAILRQDIEKIPVLVIIAVDVDDRASAFVGHNTDRLAVTPMQLHHAKVTAKDPDALAVERVCSEAGVHLVQHYYGDYPWKQGDTVSVTTIDKLVKRRGPERAVALLKVLVEANIPPIKADQIKAVEYIFTETFYADRLEPLPVGGMHIAKAIHDCGIGVLHEVRVKAEQEKIQAFKALGMTWFSRCKHKRAA